MGIELGGTVVLEAVPSLLPWQLLHPPGVGGRWGTGKGGLYWIVRVLDYCTGPLQ